MEDDSKVLESFMTTVVPFIETRNQKKFCWQFVSLYPTLLGGKEAEKSFILYMFEVLVKCESKWKCPLAMIYWGLE